MDLNTIWFILYAVLITGYAILDGFDLGVGVLHLFARNDHERRIHLNAIGPVWDGNEVWLLTAGGALFAAFPMVYATVFSGFYLALMLVLLALIGRAVSMEFRGKIDSPGWKRAWDWTFGMGSLVAALLFGVAVGNILRGLPIDARGNFTGSFFTLLNPYALVIGVLTLVMFTLHGAQYLLLKSEGDLAARLKSAAPQLWMGTVALYILATVATFFAASWLLDGVFGKPLFWVFFVLTIGSMVLIPVSLQSGRHLRAFLASSVMIGGMIGVAAVSMFPVLVPSTTDAAFSLTAYNASSTQRTLQVMLVIALVGMPLVIGYTAFIYRVFKGKTVLTDTSY